MSASVSFAALAGGIWIGLTLAITGTLLLALFRSIPLDKLLGGLQKSDLIIFAGRPGMGKTSFMLSAAINLARLGARIAVFSMEMGVEQIVQRLVSMEAAINSQNLRTGQLSQQEYSRFVHAAGNLSNFRIFIDDKIITGHFKSMMCNNSTFLSKSLYMFCFFGKK